MRKSTGLRLAVFFGSFCVLLLISSLISGGISKLHFGDERTHYLLSSIVQSLLVFCVPAFLLAKYSSNNPGKWLKINTKINYKPFLGIIIVYLISLPAMEWLIEWNKNLHLPAYLNGLENTLRGWENANEAASNILLDAHGVGAILTGVLVIGILTGFSEELFFRSGFQGILVRTNLGKTTAIWLGAFFFSYMHFQFFGFFPRLLMGAFFGYLLYWTSDMKTASFAHILNNSMVVITAAFSGGENLTASELSIIPQFPYIHIISCGLTVLFFIFLRGYFFKVSHSSIKSHYKWQRSQLPPITGR